RRGRRRRSEHKGHGTRREQQQRTSHVLITPHHPFRFRLERMNSMARWKIAAIAATVFGAAAALAIGLTRGGSTHLSWTPTESSKPVRSVTITPNRTYTF